MITRVAQFALAVALAASGGGAARALLLPTFESAAFANGQTTVTYNLRFDEGNGIYTLNPGDFATLYDVFDPSVTAFSAAWPQGNFAVSTQALGPNAPFSVSPDSAALGNVVFTYAGRPLTTDAVVPVTVSLTGDFTGPTRVGRYSSEDTLLGGYMAGSISFVRLPSLTPAAVAAVP